MYRWQNIKTLKAEGISIKKIARPLKISRNTVRKYLMNSYVVFTSGCLL
ncbi:MAG TPA: hypothetical protein DCW46_01120 [Desulfotomaculum sp.]|nr:hypothetical protein [Desulfotomaculum sp.]